MSDSLTFYPFLSCAILASIILLQTKASETVVSRFLYKICLVMALWAMLSCAVAQAFIALFNALGL